MKKNRREKYLITNRIEEELILQNKTQSWLAKETGIHKSYISKLIADKHEPKVNTIVKICHALGKNIDELWSVYEIDE